MSIWSEVLDSSALRGAVAARSAADARVSLMDNAGHVVAVALTDTTAATGSAICAMGATR